MCLYTYILRSSGIFVSLYKQILDVIDFHVWMCLYACITRLCGMLVYEHSLVT